MQAGKHRVYGVERKQALTTKIESSEALLLEYWSVDSGKSGGGWVGFKRTWALSATKEVTGNRPKPGKAGARTVTLRAELGAQDASQDEQAAWLSQGSWASWMMKDRQGPL